MRLVTEDFRALAEFRHQVRRFLAVSEEIAYSGRLQPQQYMLLLALRGLPAGKEPTIFVLAERLQIRHNSAVELANRLAKRGLIRRLRSKSDSRMVLIRLTRKGTALIEKLVGKRFVQLHSSQPELIKALNRVLARTNNRGTQRRTASTELPPIQF
jgi:DNA-binding MarR family transcriptional regulator